MSRRPVSSPPILLLFLAVGLAAGCHNVEVLVEDGRLTFRLFVNPESLELVIEGEAQAVEVTLQRQAETGPVNLTVNNVPTGVMVQIEQPGITNTGRVTFQATRSAVPQQGAAVIIIASDGSVFDMGEVTLDILP